MKLLAPTYCCFFWRLHLFAGLACDIWNRTCLALHSRECRALGLLILAWPFVAGVEWWSLCESAEQDGHQRNVLGTAVSFWEVRLVASGGDRLSLHKGVGTLQLGLLGKWRMGLSWRHIILSSSNIRHVPVCSLSCSPVLYFISVRAVTFSSKRTLWTHCFLCAEFNLPGTQLVPWQVQISKRIFLLDLTRLPEYPVFQSSGTFL